jgi:hypothetical protein
MLFTTIPTIPTSVAFSHLFDEVECGCVKEVLVPSMEILFLKYEFGGNEG